MLHQGTAFRPGHVCRRPGLFRVVLRPAHGRRVRHSASESESTGMKYAAVIEYITDKDKIQSVRPVHRQYLATLKAAGQLAASGPFTDDYGALIIYEANSMEEAE